MFASAVGPPPLGRRFGILKPTVTKYSVKFDGRGKGRGVQK